MVYPIMKKEADYTEERSLHPIEPEKEKMDPVMTDETTRPQLIWLGLVAFSPFHRDTLHLVNHWFNGVSDSLEYYMKKKIW